MTVTPFERGRYFVSSNSGQPPYLVDLEHQDEPTDKPRARCDCFPFKKARKKAIERGEQNPAIECKHIRLAREFEKGKSHDVTPKI